MVTQTLQAVVLCSGLGSRMTSLTDHIPKCMLPIAGIPMFWYPLNFLQRNSIREVIMIVAERLLDEIKQLLSSSALPPLTDLQIEFVKLSSAAEYWGTADVLRFINSRIKKDFIVVSGDFVSDMNLAPMLSLHASENAALTCLLCDRVITGPVPGPKMKPSKERDFVVLSGNNQLLFNGSEEDYDETVPVNVNLLDKCRITYFTAKYNDCHLYIMKKCILNIIEKHRELNSLKADLIPYILEKQNAKEDYEMIEHIGIDPLDEKIQKFSFGTTATKSLQNPLKCFAYLLSPENGFIVGHVNTIGAYFEINKAIIRFLSSRFSEKIPVGHAIIDDNYTATISDCYVGSTTHLLQQSAGEAHAARSEKPVIKRSVIGEKCVLGPRSKIVGSLLMDRCQIGAGAQIINSIICTDAEIGENTYISSSIVVCRQIVSAKARVHNELIAPNDEVELEKWTQEQWLAIWDRSADRFSTDLAFFVSSASHTSVLDIPREESYFDTEKHVDDSWLLRADFGCFMEIWKPHAELDGGEWERSQSTSAVVTRNVKDALPNQGPLSITQSLLPLNSLPKNSTTTGNKKQQLDKWYCVFCYNNARFTYEKGGIVLHPQLDGPWQTHVCKDSNGLVICPVLAAHICRYCGATGIFAHTEKYCDSEKKRSLHVMSLRRID